MSTSTNGQICYGIAFEEGFEFPWGENSIENWWLEDVLKFKHSFEIYTPEGDYIGGVEPEQTVIDKYYKEKKDFKAVNPKPPIELVNYCSCDYPMYILAIPSTIKEAYRGSPEFFNPSDLSFTNEEQVAFLEFLSKFNIKYEGNPQWLLSSYWG